MLNDLLVKNAYGGGLTPAERVTAEAAIIGDAQAINPLAPCWVCQMYGKLEPSLEDTGLCCGHAFYALVRRK